LTKRATEKRRKPYTMLTDGEESRKKERKKEREGGREADKTTNNNISNRKSGPRLERWLRGCVSPPEGTMRLRT
jgi:hypothetical protein